MANPTPAPESAATSAQVDWFVRIVFAGQPQEWVFACPEAIKQEIEAAMVTGRLARWNFDGTEGFINPAHIARLEFTKQG